MIDFPASPTNGQVFVSGAQSWTFDGTKWVASGNAVMPPLSTGDNRVVNGDMRIDQRNNGGVYTWSASTAAYCVDRWWGAASGGTITGQRVANAGPSVSPSQFVFQFTGGAGVTGIQLGQRIEAAQSFDLAGGNATLSVNLANSLLTTVTWVAYYANTADTFGPLTAPTKTSIGSGTFTVTSTMARYSTTIAIPAAATTGIEIQFFVGAQISGTWSIGNVKLEVGSVATPFNRQSLAKSMADCQRYYQQFSSAFMMSGWNNATGLVYSSISLPVVMRATPTVAFGTVSYSNASALAVNAVNVDVLRTSLTITSTGMGFGSAPVTFNAEL